MNNQNTPVISFVAKSGTGKTTLIEKVVKMLKTRNYKVAVIKHDAHEFEMDKPGKDTWRISEAGADIVAIASPTKMALIEKTGEEKSLDDIIAVLPKADIILTEGFKHNNKPKVEVFRSAVHKELVSDPAEILAIASDIPWNIGVPCYHIDDVDNIVKEIIQYVSKYNG